MTPRPSSRVSNSSDENPAARDRAYQPGEQQDYQARLAKEKNFFKTREAVHALPDIFHYWSNKYIRPKLAAVGFQGWKELFSDSLLNQCERRAGDATRFLSIGCGNCDLEIELALKLRASGHSQFVIDCLDVNETLLEQGQLAAAGHGISDQVNIVRGDFNEWRPACEYDGVIAMEALHHVLNLEGLLAGLRESLRPGGCFVISDMIGRNGHLRWPEALLIVHEFWRKLPPSYRYNHQLQRYEELFEDWDCSQVGFEGVRSQDILPLLIENFHFERFVAFGNVIDPFVDRSFGHNFDAAAEWDRAFIDLVHQRDEEEIAAGRIKPTHMYAVLGTAADQPAIFLDPLSPAFCIRWPDAADQGPTSPKDSEGNTQDEQTQAYEWHAWPHCAQRELEIACRRLRDSAKQLQKLEREFEERTAWALQLDKEFGERTAWALQLDKDLAERTAWASGLDRELAERTAWALQLNKQLEEQTAYALKLEKELREVRTLSERPSVRGFRRQVCSLVRKLAYFAGRIN
jgi:SAM-dependent methyltransferase